jgi:hypothetical protein
MTILSRATIVAAFLALASGPAVAQTMPPPVAIEPEAEIGIVDPTVGMTDDEAAVTLPGAPLGTGGIPGVSTPSESAITEPYPGGAHNFSDTGN